MRNVPEIMCMYNPNISLYMYIYIYTYTCIYIYLSLYTCVYTHVYKCGSRNIPYSMAFGRSGDTRVQELGNLA